MINKGLPLLLMVAMGLFSFYSKKVASDNGDEVVTKLETLGYYKYAAPDRVPALKDDLKDSYKRHKVLSTITNSKTLLPHDYRLYFCDGEALFEHGGIEEYLGYARHAFERRGLKLEWENEISEQKGSNWNHRITVNGKEYIAFEGSTKRLNRWVSRNGIFINS